VIFIFWRNVTCQLIASAAMGWTGVYKAAWRSSEGALSFYIKYAAYVYETAKIICCYIMSYM
jgi:hypothetical protein